MSKVVKQLLTPAETRERLGIGKNRMYEILANDKTFPAFRIGTTWFINADKLKDWIDAQTNNR
ncbi:helix-turn-helix domain-containing protein [Clostridium neonatale]|uniref:Helix-turn-helix domain-containing protein n=1 Tax=Clostridium neonatale TaxID=137838 RepID=A0AAD1YBE5_9CLOT|nr:helix-turn-helix domain-containing protein [Clostridium neonatale]CAI3193265.1 conserved hypothetical protein [Clostridium neonatale]CAI3197020.1 conserved hypothetical protein [Clostridium neonatale]CAI3214329.1 conserved hypothetical protein [Clostridium neonatale]CAI3218005.1 conserved hypothetical protein [Clostridium neonatale]CAI3239661.1 conserved hypothetical protein [Clostridium neonatale]